MSQLTATPPASPRFSWPVRILLFLVLFDMFFRSTDVLYPWGDWLDELAVEQMPRPLPTPAKIAELRDKANGSYDPVLDEFKESIASLPRFWCPYPKAETLELLQAVQIRWGDLRLNPLNAKQQEEHRLDTGYGLRIAAVSEKSAAEKAGLKPGDILVKINDRPLPNDPDALNDLLHGMESNGNVQLTLIRDGEEQKTDVAMPSSVSAPEWETALLWIKYSLAWTASRLGWCEGMMNIDQEWPMFSPNVSKKKYPARARLLFADGTEKTVRQRSDPEDLTAYFRLSPGKNLAYDHFVADDSGTRYYACPGWCRILAQEYPKNEAGSPLKEIRVYQVCYEFPKPNEDAYKHLKRQMELTRDHNTRSEQVWTTFFIYWPDKNDWRFQRAVRTINAQTIE